MMIGTKSARVHRSPSCAELLLEAASQLSASGDEPFSAERLIVAAWQHAPKAFGLRGYQDQHPDSNRIIAELVGQKGLVAKGRLERVAAKLYRLPQAAKHANPRRAVDCEGKRLLGSRAVQKWEAGQKQEINFIAACDFWGITEDLCGDALQPTLDQVTRFIVALPDGGDRKQIEAIHEYLQERFARHLALLRKRKGA